MERSAGIIKAIRALGWVTQNCAILLWAEHSLAFPVHLQLTCRPSDPCAGTAEVRASRGVGVMNCPVRCSPGCVQSWGLCVQSCRVRQRPSCYCSCCGDFTMILLQRIICMIYYLFRHSKERWRRAGGRAQKYADKAVLTSLDFWGAGVRGPR